MQYFFLWMMPPSLRWVNASVGHALAHGAGSQARQSLASKPVDNPPAEAMRIPALFHDKNLWTCLEQDREHEWQPIQRSMRAALRAFIFPPPYGW